MSLLGKRHLTTKPTHLEVNTAASAAVWRGITAATGIAFMWLTGHVPKNGFDTHPSSVVSLEIFAATAPFDPHRYL